MERFLIYARRHWQAMLVCLFFVWRLSRGDFKSNFAMWLAVGLAILGMLMNFVVIMANRGMPAQVLPDEIPDSERLHYHSISQTTRLTFLSDWIPVGDLLISPGDIVLFVAAAILLFESLVGF